MKTEIEQYFIDTLGVSGAFKVDEKAKQITFGFVMAPFWADLKKALFFCDEWTYQLSIKRHHLKPGLKGHPEIKNVIVVASGKGGVGKSTTSVNVALALKRQGANVGLLDADIYGPSLPLMLGLNGRHPSKQGENETIPPLMAYGMQSMSLGYLLEQDSLPMVWRGPMATRALTQLFGNTHWQGLDYLIIDMPPGTGDIPLSLVQKVPIAGALLVTTPQDIALMDVRKAYRMFNKVSIPVLGIVENMATYHCPNCHHESSLFGEKGADKLLKEFDGALLGQLPLVQTIRSEMDKGTPHHLFNDELGPGAEYHKIASKMTAYLSLQKKDYSMTFNKVTVE